MNRKLIALLLTVSLIFVSGSIAVFAEGDSSGVPDGSEAAGINAADEDFWIVEKADEAEDAVTLKWKPKDEDAELSDDPVFEIFSGDEEKPFAKLEKEPSDPEENEDYGVYDAYELTEDGWFSYRFEKGDLSDSSVITISSGEERTGTIDFSADEEKAEKAEKTETAEEDVKTEEAEETEQNKDAEKPELQLSLKAASSPSIAIKSCVRTHTTAKLVWETKNATGKEVYDVFVGNTKKTDKPVSGNAYRIKGLKAGKKYTVTVKMKTGAGAKSYAAEKKLKVSTYGFRAKLKNRTDTSMTITLAASKKFKKRGKYDIYYFEVKDKKVLNKKPKLLNSKPIVLTEESKKTYYKNYTFKVKTGYYYKFYIREHKGGLLQKIGAYAPMPNVTGFKAASTANGVILKWNPVKVNSKDKDIKVTSYTIAWSGNGKKGKITVKPDACKGHYFWTAPDEIYTFSIRADRKGSMSSIKPAIREKGAVRTMYYSFVFGEDRYLESQSGGSGEYFSAGTEMTAVGFSRGAYEFNHNGKRFRVSRYSTYGADVATSRVDQPYTKGEAQSFVNRLAIPSNTDRLIWVNTFTQREYIFKEAANGKWVCTDWDWIVSTGAPSAPTSTGRTWICQKDPQEHDSYYWSVCKAGFSIHSKPPSQGQPLGWPFSGSCVRNTYDHAEWIYYNCDVGTSVYVF